MKNSSSMVACDQSSLLPPITKLLSCMEGVLQTSEIAKVEVYKSKTVKLGIQEYGCRVQDAIEVSTLTQFDHENCALCCHRFLVLIVERR